VDRVLAAWDLTTADRVPITINAGFWPVVEKGMTPYDAMTQTQKACDAWVDFNIEFQPDTIVSPMMYTVPSSVFEVLDYKLYAWPGHGTSKETSFQYNEKEWMLPEEYDNLISDPSDYMLRTYLPRTVGAFAGFGKLSSLFDFIELPFVSGNVGGWGTPEMADGLKRIADAAAGVAQWGAIAGATMGKLDWAFPDTSAAAARLRSTSSATLFAVPRASSWTCSAARTKCLRPASASCQ
jgi:hypothetical protein